MQEHTLTGYTKR